MRRVIIIIGLSILLINGLVIAAEIKYFYSDGTIKDGDSWYGVRIYDTPPNHTTVLTFPPKTVPVVIRVPA